MNNGIEIFHPKFEKTALLNETIVPNRFVWHIRDKERSSDLSIAAAGLVCPNNFAVFAHNGIRSFNNTYPYYIDLVLGSYGGGFFKEADLNDYSFWRIDTLKVGAIWFVDPFMKSEALNSNGISASPRNFVCTHCSIPPEALKLFYFDGCLYNERPPYITRGEGVVNACPRRTDFDCLVPDVKMNDYMEWRARNAINRAA